MFGSAFQFLHLKIAVFRFWCLPQFAGFLQVSLWFSVFVSNDDGFSFFFFFFVQRHFTVFLVLPVSNSKGAFI